VKVVHVIDALGLGGGAEQALLAQLPRLREHGVESSIVCLYPREAGLFRDALRLGFPVTVLPGRSWPARVRQLRGAIAAENPDLVHSALLHSNVATRLAMVGSRRPQLNSLVNTTYDPARISLLGLSPWRMEVVRTLDATTARLLGDHFHALTRAVADEASSRLGIPEERITVIPRGRDASTLGARSAARSEPVRRSLGVPEGSRLVVTVGRQDLQKSQPDLVRAVARARLTVPGIHLAVAGRPGAATETIRAAIEEVGGHSYVHLLGHRTDVPDLIASADVFALPSVYEGLGSVLIEAMAIGTPIVGSDAPAIEEVLGGGRFGLIAPRGEVGALADTLVKALTEPETAARCSAAKEHFAQHFTLERVTDRTLRLYEHLCSRDRGPGEH
jgi:glycosyltransferase involved in cell wall biosynthesis